MMPHLKRPIVIWLVLVAATLLSYASWLDAQYADPRVLGSIVILIALAKAWLIGWRFMELDESIWPLRLLFTLWIALVGAILVVMFWLTP